MHGFLDFFTESHFEKAYSTAQAWCIQRMNAWRGSNFLPVDAESWEAGIVAE